ncbi:Dihydropteroate synthase-like protein [Lipomyces kononenkoae]|uniref:Dihydropteroate synthase-like protein n=1 Tax=Lipomyces kononenkoae TaxID=34357 RepID=A0ACC3T7L7_LIPKO
MSSNVQPPPILPPDVISIRGLSLKTSKAGLDTWHRAGRSQPVTVDAWVRAPVAVAGISDLVTESVHYGTLCKAITKVVETNAAVAGQDARTNPKKLATEVIESAFDIGAENVRVRLCFPKKLLRADGAGVEVAMHRYTPYGSDPVTIDVDEKAFIEGLHVFGIIGVNPWERLEKQEVVIGVDVHGPGSGDADVVRVADEVVNVVENASFQTIEALVTALTRFLCVDKALEKVTVKAEKPRAIAFARGPAVQITRSRRYYSTEATAFRQQVNDKEHIAYLGMGSNLGERAALMSAALIELENRGIRVLATSSMYESAPMYVENQPRFLNAVCKIATTMTPHELLAAVQDVEKNALGRVKLIDKGPRSIDLDILLYDDIVLRDGKILSIPHLLMLEREFVLRPLAQLAPDYIHPVTCTTIAKHLDHLCPPDEFISDLYTVIPLKLPRGPINQLMFDTIHHVHTPTHLMAILNVTPDSFSDGGDHISLDDILATARDFVANKATIIDIGGQSTHPKSVNPGPAVELERVLPAIKLLRSHKEFDNVVISVDTYYASVARGAVEAGADIINDVSAGALDPDMFPTAVRLDVPIVLMHTRGTPQTMSSMTQYANDDVIADAADELAERVREAEKAGIKRWNMILDPGLGFAKNSKQNLNILRELKFFIHSRREFDGLPWLLGPSRKGFIGKLTGREQPKDRVAGTGAAISACIAGGAEIVRVHDPKEIGDVLAVADMIYRNPASLALRKRK